MEPAKTIQDVVYSVFKIKITEQEALRIFSLFSEEKNQDMETLEKTAALFLQKKMMHASSVKDGKIK
jgi:hypothetical protein